MAETQTPTAAERKAIRVGYSALGASRSPNPDVVETVVAALGSAKLLQSPETAAEVSANVLTGVVDAIGGMDPGSRCGQDYENGWRNAVHAVTERLRHMVAQFAEIAEDGESRVSLGAFVPCANARCQRGEWSGKATERGWEQTDEGWLCPQCAADRRDYLQAKAEGGEAL